MKILIILFCFSFSFVGFSAEAIRAKKTIVNKECQNCFQEINLLTKKIDELEIKRSYINEELESIHTDLAVLQKKSLSYEVKIQYNLDQSKELLKGFIDLSKQIAPVKTGMSFETIASILLTAVAVLVAVFGVIAGYFAIWGYRDIKKTAVDASVEESKKEFKNAMTLGKFDDAIYDAIGKVAFGDIKPQWDTDNSYRHEKEDILTEESRLDENQNVKDLPDLMIPTDDITMVSDSGEELLEKDSEEK